MIDYLSVSVNLIFTEIRTIQVKSGIGHVDGTNTKIL